MYVNTQAIILKRIKHTDSSSIIHAYTRDLGQIAFVYYGHRKRKAKSAIVLFTPGILLELELQVKGTQGLYQCKDAKLAYPLSYHSSPYKNAILTFTCELLQKSLREEEENPVLYDYLVKAFLTLDQREKEYSNFHLVFMLELSRYLGFYPYKEGTYALCFFDLQEGIFLPGKPLHPLHCDMDTSARLSNLMELDYSNMHLANLDRYTRNKLTQALVKYYQTQLSNIGEFKTMVILQEIFD